MVFGVVTFHILLAFLAASLVALIVFRKRLTDKKIEDRIGNFYAGVRIIRIDRFFKRSYLYFPTFLLHRVSFVLIPFIFMNHPTF